jgi:hypothetical protein
MPSMLKATEVAANAQTTEIKLVQAILNPRKLLNNILLIAPSQFFPNNQTPFIRLSSTKLGRKQALNHLLILQEEHTLTVVSVLQCSQQTM